MAVTDAYASAPVYRKLISKTDSAEDAEIDTDLKAVSRYLDRMLGRFFTRDAGATARIFAREPRGDPRLLWVDDLAVAPTSIKIDENGDGGFAGETALAAADFELWPLNAGKGPEPRPWTMIHLRRSRGTTGWPAGRRVEVTAQWGWPAIPHAVARATVHLTAILRLETPRATMRVPELGDAFEASREAQGIVRELAGAYRRLRF